MNKVLLILLIMAGQYQVSAQTLHEHKWKDRILLIYARDFSSDKLQKQVELLEKEKEGVEERKLVVYQITDNKYKVGLDGQKYSREGTLPRADPYSVVLIGLDGTEKLRDDNVVTADHLFSVIDAMPMRQAEMREQKN